jgi:Rod binding domain-containing protein
MDSLRLETLSLKPKSSDDSARQHAAGVADQFEAIFVRTMVQSLRQSATVGGEGGMFGSGPGADTYADWFDQNLADRLAKNGGIGIKEALMAEFERSGEFQPEAKSLRSSTNSETELDRARMAADRSGLKIQKNLLP